MAAEAPAAEVHRVLSTAIDAHFYRTMYPDVSTAGLSALDHYFRTGWREGRDPAPWFSNASYLDANEDVRAAGLEPLFHYLTVGRHEGRKVETSKHAQTYLDHVDWEPPEWRPEHVELLRPPAEPPAGAEPDPSQDAGPRSEDELLIEAEFDAAWYLAANPDVAAAGRDPLWHFVYAGWREGRDPTRWFSVRDYLETYPDIANSGANPFVHYVTAGKAEGRITRLDLGFRYSLIAGATPPSERVSRAIAADRRIATGDVEALVKALRAAPRGLADLHVTFSHDDYTATYGGMQLCLRRESGEMMGRGLDHLHLHPAKPWPTARPDARRGVVGVLLNGQRLGVYETKEVAAAVRRAVRGRAPARRSFAIHSMLGHSTADVVELLGALKLRAGFFWLHDFASLCAGYHLLRNDVEDCAAPPPDSAACRICSYGPLRASQQAAHADLFAELDLTVVAPSRTTLNFWTARADYGQAAAVALDHAHLVDRGPAKVSDEAKRPLRVAFLGMPAPLKGWPIFAALAARHAHDKRYRFIHLGGQPDPRSDIEFHEVIACEQAPDAMRAKMEALQIDVAVVWPLCRETFSFTAYEAAAAGSAVVTWPDSGNVAAFVAETGHGRVLPDEAALEKAFANGSVRALSRAKRKAHVFDLRYSGMTADLLDGGRA